MTREHELYHGVLVELTITMYASGKFGLAGQEMDVCAQTHAAQTVEAALDSIISAEALSVACRTKDVMLVLARVIQLFLTCHRAGVEIVDTGPHNLGYNGLIISGRVQRPISIVWIDWENCAKRPTPKRSMLYQGVRRVLSRIVSAFSKTRDGGFVGEFLQCHIVEQWWHTLPDEALLGRKPGWRRWNGFSVTLRSSNSWSVKEASLPIGQTVTGTHFSPRFGNCMRRMIPMKFVICGH